MADKVIAIKVQVEGTTEQKKQLTSLQSEVDKLAKRKRELNKEEKDGLKTQQQASKERADLNLQLKANRNALRDLEAQILKENDALRKNSGFVEGIKKAITELSAEEKVLVNRQNQITKEIKNATNIYGQNSSKVVNLNKEYKNVSKSISNVRNKITNLNKTVVNNNKTINNNITNINKLGDGFKRLGTSVGAAFVGLFAIQKIGQLFSSAIDTIKEFEQQMANVKAITGATEEEFQKLEKSAKELGATTQFTAKEVGQLQEEYAKLGFTTDQILDASEAT